MGSEDKTVLLGIDKVEEMVATTAVTGMVAIIEDNAETANKEMIVETEDKEVKGPNQETEVLQ